MGCHPSHWRTPSFFKIVIAPPTSTYIPVISHYLQLWDGTPPGTLTGKACSEWWLRQSFRCQVSVQPVQWSWSWSANFVPQDPHHELMAGCPNLQGGSGSAQSWQPPAGSTMIHIENINNCEVVWNMFEYVPQYLGWWSNLTKSYFSEGVGIPPIRQCQENIQVELLHSSSDSPYGCTIAWCPLELNLRPKMSMSNVRFSGKELETQFPKSFSWSSMKLFNWQCVKTLSPWWTSK